MQEFLELVASGKVEYLTLEMGIIPIILAHRS